ncbi:hypothetical protein [Algoriphagus limi]|uniref:Tetratricopeptide repeat-containing protein n=1 Tax=Algoriphagus limi TaxID=2975273 RepID=A0ABT2G6G4_9BACT|nr:hypothetical protein [Algoriphagus limi]MCS5490861.1 hypothetical protein [Algoriphagus limi]
MKKNSKIFATVLMVVLMAMRYPQELRKMNYQAYLETNKALWKQNVGMAYQAFQQSPTPENELELALTEFGLLNATMADEDEALFEAYVDGLEERLEGMKKSGKNQAEAKALLSGLYGYKIAFSPFKGMLLGGKSSKLIAEAMEEAPENPIVLKLYASNKYFTPSMWGGDVEIAQEAFEKSNALFEKQGVQDNWMYLDNLAWLGMIYRENGLQDEARQVWEKAVEIEPDFHWVAQGLLPSLN